MTPRPGVHADEALPAGYSPKGFEWLRSPSSPTDEVQYPSRRSADGSLSTLHSVNSVNESPLQAAHRGLPSAAGSNLAALPTRSGASTGAGGVAQPAASTSGSNASAAQIAEEAFCLGTAVHMAAVAARPRALESTGLAYRLTDEHETQTQFLSKTAAEGFFMAVLQVESLKATLTGAVKEAMVRSGAIIARLSSHRSQRCKPLLAVAGVASSRWFSDY